jgi:hypothetical protein
MSIIYLYYFLRRPALGRAGLSTLKIHRKTVPRVASIWGRVKNLRSSLLALRLLVPIYYIKIHSKRGYKGRGLGLLKAAIICSLSGIQGAYLSEATSLHLLRHLPESPFSFVSIE